MPGPAITRDATEATFATDVLDVSRSRGVVVDFWAPWCGPCHQLAPVLERVAARYTGAVDLVKVNVDDAPGLSRQYQVQGIPAVKAFRNGEVVGELVGVQPEPAIEQLFSSVAPSEADRLVEQAEGADPEERERLLRAALEVDPGHVPGVSALARLLAERGESSDAIALLERVPADDEAARLRAELRLAADRRDPAELDRLRGAAAGGDERAALELGRALAADGSYEEAVSALLAAVRAPATREEGRRALLEVFKLLGDDHELVRASRPQLAAALF